MRAVRINSILNNVVELKIVSTKFNLWYISKSFKENKYS